MGLKAGKEPGCLRIFSDARVDAEEKLAAHKNLPEYEFHRVTLRAQPLVLCVAVANGQEEKENTCDFRAIRCHVGSAAQPAVVLLFICLLSADGTE